MMLFVERRSGLALAESCGPSRLAPPGTVMSPCHQPLFGVAPSPNWWVIVIALVSWTYWNSGWVAIAAMTLPAIPPGCSALWVVAMITVFAVTLFFEVASTYLGPVAWVFTESTFSSRKIRPPLL